MAQDRNLFTDEQIAAFLDGNASVEETEAMLSSLPFDSELDEILSLSPLIDSMVDSELDSFTVLPMRALAAANPCNMCSFDCEVEILNDLGIDTDHWTLLETAKANNWVREAGTPLHHVGRLLEMKGIHVRRKYDATVADIAAALADNMKVIVIISNDSGRLHAVMPEKVTDKKVIYSDPGAGTETEIIVSEFEKIWKASGCYMVAASDKEISYNPTPIAVDDITLDEELTELTEAIAENAHDIWARARMDEGWTYGPVRDDKALRHPDLVPYAQLPDSEKHYDRIMAMNTLRLVRRLGFDIVSRGK